MKKEMKLFLIILLSFIFVPFISATSVSDLNITVPKVYSGFYNWTENSPLLSFDGSTLSFDWATLNNSYASIYYTKAELDLINTSNNNYLLENNQSVNNWITQNNLSVINWVTSQNYLTAFTETDPLWTANYSTFLLNNVSITNTFGNYYTKSESDTMNTSINNWVSSLSLSDFTNNLNIGNWTADKSSYYTSAQTDTEISNANTSINNWADSKFVTNSGGDSLSGQYDFNGGWTSNGLSVINGNLYAQSVYAYNYSGLNVYTLATNGSLIPTMDNQFDLGNSTLKWRNLNLGGNISAGTTLFVNQGTGNVGIGTVGPTSKLGLLGNLAVGATYGTLAAPTSGAIIEGNVGIGTASPQETMHVVDSSSDMLRWNKEGATPYGTLGAGTAGVSLNAYSPSAGYGFAYLIDGSELMRLTNTGGLKLGSSYMSAADPGAGSMIISGNVGIGTTSPLAKLHVVGVTNSTLGFSVGANTGLTQNFQMLNATSLSCWMNYTGGILTTSNC